MGLMTGPNTGNMDRKITIQTAVEAQSTSGAIITTYVTASRSIWCEVREPREREIQAAMQTAGQIDRVFLTWWSTGITQTSRILYDDGLGERTYEILGPPEELGRRTRLRLQARVLRAT